MSKRTIKTLNFFDDYLLLNQKSVVLDIGANIGNVTNLIHEKYNFKYDKKNTEKIRSSSTIHKNFVRSFGLLFKNKKII
tara:strand:- start:15 stop:251 length:237 start_codon:yes stop_codon:yes gene_type:complete